MFHSSTQNTFWTFSSAEELKQLRENANTRYRTDYCTKNTHIDPSDDNFFITVKEHQALIQYHENILRDLCWKFNPPMPLNTVGTACFYMKRLYLRKSVMEYHPKIMFLVCIWLACKTEEFNISMEQFVRNIPGANEQTGDAVLTMELLLIQELNFHLTIHNSFRPMEGFLIDIKTRFSNLKNPEQLRKLAKDFIVKSLSTDAGLLFSPSQIALAALLSSASKNGINIDRYVTDVLLHDQSPKLLKETITRIKSIRTMVKEADPSFPPKQIVSPITERLQRCYNKAKDPTSDEYSQIQHQLEIEKSEKQSKKRKLEHERRQKIEADLLGF